MMNTPLIITSILIALIFTIIFIISRIIAKFWCMPKKIPNTKTPGDFQLPYENIEFSNSNITLKGWFISSNLDINKSAVIILQHGWSKNASFMLPVTQILHEVNYNLLLFDSRGHGDSDKAWPVTPYFMAKDLSAAVDYLEKRSDICRNRIAVVGHSIGGSSSILAAAWDSRIKAIVSSSAFADPILVTINQLKRYYLPKWPFVCIVLRFIQRWSNKPISYVFARNFINKIEAPVALLHGGKDSLVSPDNLNILYEESKKDRTESHLIPECGHSDIIEHSKYKQVVIDFFKHNLP